MEMETNEKCRVCLRDDVEMHNMYDEFDQGVTLLDIFNTTLCKQVEDDSDEELLSPYLCAGCTTIIVDFYNLKVIYEMNLAEIKNTHYPEEEDGGKNEELPDKDNEEEIKNQAEGDRINILDNTDDPGEKSPVQNQQSEEILIKCEDDLDEVPSSGFLCSQCDYYFLYKQDFLKHMTFQHNIDWSLTDNNHLFPQTDKRSSRTCNICRKSFQTRDSLLVHLELHKKNICDVCGATFAKKSYLRDHKDVHETEKRHVCNFCNKAFKRRTVLVKHRRIHTHPRQAVCEICGKAFNDKGTLNTHIMLLHLKTRNFVCMICGMKFPLKATLDKHIRRHQNKEREFFCTQCPLAYKDKSSLDRHIQTKHNEITVKAMCPDCNKPYASVSNMLKHRRAAHQINLVE